MQGLLKDKIFYMYTYRDKDMHTHIGTEWPYLNHMLIPCPSAGRVALIGNSN